MYCSDALLHSFLLACVPVPSAKSNDGAGAGRVSGSASKSSIRRFVITEKAPTRAFSRLKAATTAFTFKTLLRHYAKHALTPTVSQREIGSATQLS